MSKKQQLINPGHLFIWFSIYLITAVPAYYIIYHSVPWGLVVVIVLEEVASYYLLDDKILDFYMEQVNNQMKMLVLLSISVIIMLINLVWLLFTEWKLCMIIMVVEILTYSVRKLIEKNKSSRDT